MSQKTQKSQRASSKNTHVRGRKNGKPAPAGTARTKELMKEVVLVFKDQVEHVPLVDKPPESCWELLDNAESVLFYMILAFLPSMYILALASTSRKMFEKIFLSKEALNYEFTQKLYIERWLTILSRNVGFSLGECSFHMDRSAPGDFKSLGERLTFEERCHDVFIRQLFTDQSFEGSIMLDDGLMTVGLDCNHLPPSFSADEEFICKIAHPSHNCNGDPYCDCGIQPSIFAEIDTLKCECLFCQGHYTHKSVEIATLKSIKEDGCPYCATKFIYTDIDFDLHLDSTCDICSFYCQGGVIPNFRCPECVHNTDHWINYCEKCWNGLPEDNQRPEAERPSIIVYQDPHSAKNIRSFCEFQKVTFNNCAKEIFVNQGTLMTLIEGDKKFFVLNKWYRLTLEILNYIAHRRRMTRHHLGYGHRKGFKDEALEEYISTRQTSFNDFIVESREWIPLPPYVKPPKDTEEEMVSKKPTLWSFIEIWLHSRHD